ncbi:anti-sigma factor family protein [Rhizobium sp. A22-96]
MTKRPITEDDLQAFVDSALDAERRQEVAEYLLTNEDAAARVSAYERHASALRAAMDPVAHEPVPSRLNLSNIVADSKRSFSRQYLQMAAAAVVLVAVGAAGGWTMKGYSLPPTEGVAALAQEASASYRVFAPDKLHPVEVQADGTGSMAQLVSATLGPSAIVPDLSKAGYRLMGARVVPTTHGPGVLFMYDDDKGMRLVMLSRRMLIDQNKPMAEYSEGSIGGWSWADNGMGFSLVGSAPVDTLHPIADEIRSQTTSSL